MDRFSEQLITKRTTGRDVLLRVLIAVAALSLIAAIVFFIGFLGWLVGLCLMAGVVWLVSWLFKGTFTEYEYIVTNDDLDIDKIIGRRKRKRLITVSLKEAKSLEEYKEGDEIEADITVMAHDETGDGMCCFVCGTKQYGDVAILFNPDERTLYNMIGGFSPSVRAKYSELYEKVKPADEESEAGTAEEAPDGSSDEE